MPLSKNINSYADVAQVLAAVVASGESRKTFRLPTTGLAVRFVQRTYQYRLLLQRQLSLAAGKGIQPATPYDKMKMFRDGPDVVIDLAPPIEGNFVEADGTLSAPPPVTETLAVPMPNRTLTLEQVDRSTQDEAFLLNLQNLAREVGDEG